VCATRHGLVEFILGSVRESCAKTTRNLSEEKVSYVVAADLPSHSCKPFDGNFFLLQKLEK
jgi:hypothetical protein